MFIAALFTVAKTWKQSVLDRQLAKYVICICYSHKKR